MFSTKKEEQENNGKQMDFLSGSTEQLVDMLICTTRHLNKVHADMKGARIDKFRRNAFYLAMATENLWDLEKELVNNRGFPAKFIKKPCPSRDALWCVLVKKWLTDTRTAIVV